MRTINFTVIKLVGCLIIGILAAHYFTISYEIALILNLTALLALSCTFIINIKRSKRTPLFGVFTLITFISIGILTTTLHNPKNQKNHYTRLINQDDDTLHNITFKVEDVLKPNDYYQKYVVRLMAIDRKEVTGQLLLNLKKDSISQTRLKIDDVVNTRTRITNLFATLNPHQFNYKDYLEKQHIYHQITVKPRGILILSRTKHSLTGYAAKLRELINSKLKNHPFKPNELAIINALLLGQRQDIPTSVYNSYAQAGAIHILAVSGLHVGIVLLILNILFKPLHRIKHGKKIKTILILIFLWSFAVIAGLSASVTRAVTMFSIVAVGMNLKRPSNVYNTLAVSMFILLLAKPMFLFDVGFQLSYLAVLAIVWIQPQLYALWTPKFWVIDKLWQVFTVTFAAQLGIFPVGIYYFHQFPLLFFISNMVIVPVLGFILGFGLLVILLAIFNSLPNFLATAFSWVIDWMNAFVALIADQDAFLIRDISFSLTLVVASYFLILALIRFYQRKTYARLVTSLIAIALLTGAFIYNNLRIANNAFIIFHKTRHTIIGIKQNRHLTLHHNPDSLNLKNSTLITNYKIGSWVNTTETDSIQPVYKINGKLILVVDSLGVYKTSFKPNYVLLSHSPKINLNRLIDRLQPELIIADGSNYKSYQDRWKRTCQEQNIPFYQTRVMGACVIGF